MRPPPTWSTTKPSSHRMKSITAIVHSIVQAPRKKD
jgi:hypothetical protein